jgi:CheY-like chemotaxis protein
MQYTVALQDVCENDQLVLRLIFSLSAKARGRTHAYCLLEHGSNSGADICIRNAADDMSLPSDDIGNTIWLNAKPNTADGNYNISKPLIASRVLSMLDRYIQERHTVAPPAQVDANVNKEASPADEMDFCISEEEASQLAIVDDESLANPANLAPSPDTSVSAHAPEPAAKPDKIASLLVLHKNREMEVSQQAFESRVQHAQASKPRALVVDDSPSVRKQIELELDLFNVDVDYAESVSDALAQLDKNHYDVAFLDVVLPDGDGFRICRSIKQNSKATKVIMLTGKATPADKIKGTMAGCDAYLVKPVGRMTFQNTACNYLQLREQLEVIHA